MDSKHDWGKEEEEHGRDWVVRQLDPYFPDQDLIDYLNETDTSPTNEEWGLDEQGRRYDDP